MNQKKINAAFASCAALAAARCLPAEMRCMSALLNALCRHGGAEAKDKIR